MAHLIQLQRSLKPLLWVSAALLLISGCGVRIDLSDKLSDKLRGRKPLIESTKQEEIDQKAGPAPTTASEFYGKFFDAVKNRARLSSGVNPIEALDALPLDGIQDRVNWTAAVVQGLIAPRASLDPDIEDRLPLDLNIFIEAKTPLMANVIFPHSIHTYWLSCGNCHPKIFLPEAGANPITMKEIWKGKWCGRCHGKVAFSPFMPRGNCTRCHMIPKGESLEIEHFN
jgi:c(7)-type cytochrome triheme protein